MVPDLRGIVENALFLVVAGPLLDDVLERHAFIWALDQIVEIVGTDEEIARGMTKLDLKELAADVGYTLDG